MSAQEIVDTPEQARDQALQPLLVREPVQRFFDQHGLGEGAIEAERIGEGHSNITYLIRRGQSHFVLRRPPRPPLPPSAHDVLREARMLEAVESSKVRTPKVLASCSDESVLGVPFYVMEHIDGWVVTTELPTQLDVVAQRRRIGLELIEALAEIHAVDWRACGLEGFGRESGYLSRQLRRFSQLWEHNKTREVERLDQVTEWLSRHMPTSPPTTIVHGDYRLGNTMFATEAPARLIAIFDWELCTLGDPLADLGYLVANYVEPGDPEDGLFKLSRVTRGEGFPSRGELIEHYAQTTGQPIPDLRFYQVLALWKSAVFLEGSYKRLLAGTTDDPFFQTLKEGVPQLADTAYRLTTLPASTK
jgi:aminoglycoside phosphotransferase (APT) family kinase protein